MRFVGKLWLDSAKNEWHLECEPHVAMWAKRIFPRVPKGKQGHFTLTNSPSICADLQWFRQRFPLDVADPMALATGAAKYQDTTKRVEQILDPNYQPSEFKMAVPAREYQKRAAELTLARGSLLLADEVGLGKSCSSICLFTDKRTLPAVVVCLAHLPAQWEREIKRFMPELQTHIIKSGKPYEIPKFFGRGPDVLIINYHKLHGWGQLLGEYCKTVVYDEIQELRHQGTSKYEAAEHISGKMQFRLGLSATPIFNFGGEFRNVIELLTPGMLGSADEFYTEWCSGYSTKPHLKDPAAFGSYLREQGLMLRRTRSDVGRELPSLTKVTHQVDSNTEALKEIEGKAGELARIILTEETLQRGDKMHAAAEFDNLLRQATGIAKAPYVAEFVRLLLENGEPVLLAGWHRSVYAVWNERLAEFKPAMYTGSEDPAKKQSEIARFIDGDTNLLIMSLRSGAGVDGLQKRCRTVVIGELDWSPGIHHQLIGRIHRDGQPDPVIAYHLISDEGVDPFIAQVLGLKTEQIEGALGIEATLQRDASEETLKKLAAEYLSKRGVATLPAGAAA